MNHVSFERFRRYAVLAVLAFGPAAFAASPDEPDFYNYNDAPPGGVSFPPSDPRNFFLGTSGGDANRLPPGVPLPPGAQFSPHGRGDPASGSPTAGFPGYPGMPHWPGMPSGAGPLGDPGFANQQSAPPSAQQPAESQSTPLASGAQWAIVPPPNTSTTQYNALNGVTCMSASDCWAVGFHVAEGWHTLIQRWDGIAWAIVPSPNTNISTQLNVLTGVTCLSASDCWAVGYHHNGLTGIESALQTLIVRWDGTSWAIVASPNTSIAQPNLLFGVTCVSASDCWAVGYHRNGFERHFLQTLIQRWDGTSWAIVNSPNASTTESSVLASVTCVSASDCWAVGFHYNTYANYANWQTLIVRWDGNSWAIVISPSVPLVQHNFLLGVTCVSASDCWAVGYHADANGLQQTLIQRWNGIVWAIVSSPNTSTAQRNLLTGVTCVSAPDCWAVGHYFNANGRYQTLIERWDGNSWAIAASPNTSTTQDNFLNGVTCTSASDCWAVGTPGSGRPLVLRYAVSPPPNTPPTARLTATSTRGNAPLNVSFDASGSSDPDSGDSIASYTFDFGDGSAVVTQAGPRITHTYTAAGRYTARLTVTDRNGAASESPATVEITVHGPLAVSLSADPRGGDVTNAPLNVTFTATATGGDPEAGAPTYTFYFGDGVNSGRQTAATARHSYAKAGTYRAHVIVANGAHQSADSEVVEITTTQTVTVTGDATTAAKLTVSLSGGVAPVTATFDSSGSTAADGATLRNYAFDFGDGSAVVHRSQSGTVQHVYTTPGSFTATLTVTDSRGGSSQATATVTVTASQRTTAQWVISPTTVKAGAPVTFDGSSSIAATGRTIVSYAFNFGDGTPVVSGTRSTVTHAYSRPGTYTPTLTVTDDAHPPASAQAKSTVTVSAPAAAPSPSRRGGGALGWLTLLPLLGAALRRRLRGRRD